MKLYELDGLNCHEAHTRAMQPGDELHYGWALGPGEVRYQHRWIVRAGEVLDLFHWTRHEDLGAIRSPDTARAARNPARKEGAC